MIKVDFVQSLEKLLMLEYLKSEEEAKALIQKYPEIIIRGILLGNLRVTAMALEMADERE